MENILKELLEAQTVLKNFIDNEKNIEAINSAQMKIGPLYILHCNLLW